MTEADTERLALLDASRKALASQTEYAETIYHNVLLEYLGIPSESPLSLVAEDLLSSATQNNLDPQRFVSEVGLIVNQVKCFSPDVTAGWFWSRLPIAETPDQFLNAAINIIRARYPSSREHDDLVTKSFKKAAEIATNPDLAEVYTWVNDHRNLLYEVHAKYWHEHFSNRDKKPEVLDPEELTPILDSDIKSALERKAQIQVLHGENSIAKTDALKAYLESVGYEAVLHFEGASDAYEPHYPVLSRVNLGSLLGSLFSGLQFRFYDECQKYVEDQQKQFQDRLEEVLTDTQKSNIDLYKRFLNPVTTPLTLGTHWLNPIFVDNKLVYLEGVEVGFNMPEAVRLMDFGRDHGMDEGYLLNDFLLSIDHIRKTEHGFSLPHTSPVQEAINTFLNSDEASILERPTKLKKLYEEKAYRIYRPY